MNKLSVDTARLISSLQVITKVESVVKELVENAFDASASSIDVKLENYGLSRIEVRDNGSGIKQDNVEYAAQRHFTSKICSTEDLTSITSYGFRGEALSSLCQVAEVFITTRTETDCFSSKYSFNDKGFVTAVKPSHLGRGTTVAACNIFSKMPVRCQLYQSESKKKQIIKNTEDVLMAFALIHPETKITFLHNKCLIWQTPTCKDSLTTMQNIMGTQITSQMKQIDHYCSQSNIHIWAFIPTTVQTRCFRKMSDRFFIFVNKRPVRDKEIENLIKQHTSHPASSQLKWPLVVLSIKLPSHNVDANVESDKSRVMIVEKELLLFAIEEMFSQAYRSLNKENNYESNCQSIVKESGAPSGAIHINPLNESCEEDGIGEPAQCGGVHLTNLTQEKTCVAGTTSGVDTRQRPLVEIQSDAGIDDMQWSKGHSEKSTNAENVQPVKILIGNHGKPNLASLDPDDAILLEQVHVLENDSSSSGWEFLRQKGDTSFKNLNTIENRYIHTTSVNRNNAMAPDDLHPMDHSISDIYGGINNSSHNSVAGCESSVRKAPRPQLNSLNPPNKRPSFGNIKDIFSSARNLKISSTPQVSHNIKRKGRSLTSTPITNWTPRQVSPHHGNTTVQSPRGGRNPTQYFEGQKRDLVFDFDSIKKCLTEKPIVTAENSTEFTTIGHLKDVKGGVLLHHKRQEIYLVNLLRLQEMKIFHSLLQNHSLRTNRLKDPIVVYIASMQSDEKLGLKTVLKSSPINANTELEIVDKRITKNGFQVFASCEIIRITEMANNVPYLTVDDLKGIFRKIGQARDVTLADSRPYKTAQYLQSEAVRISTSTPVHRENFGIPCELMDRFDSVFDMRCFHDKPLFHSIYRVAT